MIGCSGATREKMGLKGCKLQAQVSSLAPPHLRGIRLQTCRPTSLDRLQSLIPKRMFPVADNQAHSFTGKRLFAKTCRGHNIRHAARHVFLHNCRPHALPCLDAVYQLLVSPLERASSAADKALREWLRSLHHRCARKRENSPPPGQGSPQGLARCLAESADTSPLPWPVDRGLRRKALASLLIPKPQPRRPQHCRSDEGTLSCCFPCHFTSTLPHCCVYSDMHGILPAQSWRRSESENWRSLPG